MGTSEYRLLSGVVSEPCMMSGPPNWRGRDIKVTTGGVTLLWKEGGEVKYVEALIMKMRWEEELW